MYQRKGDKNVGCDPDDYRECRRPHLPASTLRASSPFAATSKYINSHMELYTKCVTLLASPIPLRLTSPPFPSSLPLVRPRHSVSSLPQP